MSGSLEKKEAYRQCRKVTARHARTFYLASLFLHREKQDACYAVYAFCRYIDDLIDNQVSGGEHPVTANAIERIILRWQQDLDNVYTGTEASSPVMVAWADVLKRYSIPRELPDLLIEGCMSDLRPTVRYETFDELYEYCYRVASVVGLMTSNIFGYSDPQAEKHAVDLGIAMQLTNILRDIGEDLKNDRIYLPREEMRRFGLNEWDLRDGGITPEFREFMKFQIKRARSYYDSANAGIAMLEHDSRLTVWLMSHNYARILDMIERNNYDVFSRRAFVPLSRKLLSLPWLWYRTVTVR